ncbi:MAG: hypothetical protein AB7P01_18110 [Bacteroidia bacterium]
MIALKKTKAPRQRRGASLLTPALLLFYNLPVYLLLTINQAK